MVLSRAGQLLPKLLDFGVARVLGGEQDPVSREGAAPGAPRHTRGGRFLGSAHFMAPEQWVDASTVDARADVYALGVVAHLALTGALPFDGQSWEEVARAHARKAPPRLGAGFPEPLADVLVRAMAKQPAERFASALELGAAFQQAARTSEEPLVLVQLRDELRDRTLHEAPQPIAEAVAALEASRSVRGAADAALRVEQTLARWTALVALAAYVRVGAAGSQSSAALRSLLKTLRAGALSDDAWWALGRELTAPFATRREIFPVPELVRFFHDGGKGGPRFEPLPADDEAALLRARLVRLNALLEELAPLFAYVLGCTRRGAVERWSGLRRAHRALLPAEPSRYEGDLSLFDAKGAWVLSLEPLVQVLPPSVGAPEEVFLLEGAGRWGAKLVARPVPFERQEEAPWHFLSEQLGVAGAEESLAEGGAAPSPYRGLLPFTAQDATSFFGREREVEAFCNRLRVDPLLAVVGPSGVGKSSFVQAGVVPALGTAWRAVILRPGANPVAALTAALGREGVSLSTPEALSEALAAAGGQWLLVVDQFEEVLTLCQDAPLRERFTAALGAAAREEAGVRVVLTLRDDFLLRAQQLPTLRMHFARGLELLSTPASEDLLRILVEPARRFGFSFEDARLPAEMVAAVREQPGALALLSFTASKLWELRDRALHLLTRRAYDAVGGVGGALAQHAEETLAALSDEERGSVRQVFRQLVTAEGTRAVLRRREMEELLGDGEGARAALERLVAARLLVASEGPDGEDRVEIIHEALLTSWPRLVRWQREDAEGARLRDQLRASARQWVERQRSQDLLWRGDALAEYRRWRDRYPGALTGDEAAFALASQNHERRARLRRRWQLAVAFAVLVAGVLSLTTLYARSVRAERTATLRLASLYEEQGRTHVLGGDPLRGAVYLSRAYEMGRDGVGIRALLGRALEGTRHELAALSGHSEPVLVARFSNRGARLLTVSRERTARLWEGRSGAPVAQLSSTSPLLRGAFSADDGRVVLTSEDGSVLLFSAADGAKLGAWRAHERGAATSAEFSPDGAWVVSSGEDGVARLWDSRTGARRGELTGHAGLVAVARFSPDGTQVLTAGGDGTARTFDARTSAPRWILRHDGPVYYATFSPDGRRVATVSEDRTARVWDVATGAALLSLEHTTPVVFAAFSPDGETLVTSSQDETPRLWSLGEGELRVKLEGHAASVRYAGFTQDGARIITGSDDGSAAVYDARTGARLCSFAGHLDTVWRADPSPDGTRLATASFDGTALLWDLAACRHEPVFPVGEGREVGARWLLGGRLVTASSTGQLRIYDPPASSPAAPQPVRTFDAPGAPVLRVAVDAAGERLAAARGQQVVVYSLATGEPLQTLAGHAGGVLSLSFSPDGTRLLTGGEDRTAKVWSLRSGAVLQSLPVDAQAVSAVAFAPKGRVLATGTLEGKVQLWNPETGALLGPLEGGHAAVVDQLSFDREGRRLVSASWDRTARVWDVASGRQLLVLEGHSSELVDATFSPDGARLFTASFDQTVRAWDAESGKALELFAAGGKLVSLDPSPDGHLLVVAAQQPVRSWKPAELAGPVAAVARRVRCRIPLQLVDEQLVRAVIPAGCEKSSHPGSHDSHLE